MRLSLLLLLFAPVIRGHSVAGEPAPAGPEAVLKGLRAFYQKTAQPDGSFRPGIDSDYRGMSDAAYSDLAAVTYAVTLHKTFGWKLPFEDKTVAFLLDRQKPSGEFVNVAGTVSPTSAEGKTYNTTQALVALRALGIKPRHNPLPVFEEILKKDYKELPPYTTSFFPLAYLCYGQPIPAKADRGIRALMVQDETGYLNDHIAATFHASHYYRLVGEATPKAEEMVVRILRDQRPDGSWLMNMPSRDRHGTFDAVFTLHQEGSGPECRKAIERAGRWALSCRNPDGGFGHYPGSTSDADAIYFQVGTLVMAGFLKPAEPLPPEPHLLSWGHLMPRRAAGSEPLSWKLSGWVGAVAFSPSAPLLAAGSADRKVHIYNLQTGKTQAAWDAGDIVSAVAFAPDGRTVATGSYDHAVRLWDVETGMTRHVLTGHRGAVLSVVFSGDGGTLASASIDGTIQLWDVAGGKSVHTFTGHRSWVNALALLPKNRLLSGSSDGTLRIWSLTERKAERTLPATDAEVRSIACSSDGRWLAAGLRYGKVKVWDAKTFDVQVEFQAHESDVWSLAFTSDASTLLTGNGDWNRPGHVKLWSLPECKPAGSFQHTGEVLSVAVAPDGRHVAAGAGDKTVRVWPLQK